jgi:hypothetical protein
MISRKRLIGLKFVLSVGAFYYFMGAIAHYAGLTLFPWFDRSLYTPYHDSLIAVASFVIALFLTMIAKNPVRNRDMIKVVIAGAILASIFSLGIIWKIDFIAIGAGAKKTQTIFEGILGFIFAGVLLWLYPKTR